MRLAGLLVFVFACAHHTATNETTAAPETSSSLSPPPRDDDHFREDIENICNLFTRSGATGEQAAQWAEGVLHEKGKALMASVAGLTAAQRGAKIRAAAQSVGVLSCPIADFNDPEGVTRKTAN